MDVCLWVPASPGPLRPWLVPFHLKPIARSLRCLHARVARRGCAPLAVPVGQSALGGGPGRPRSQCGLRPATGRSDGASLGTRPGPHQPLRGPPPRAAGLASGPPGPASAGPGVPAMAGGRPARPRVPRPGGIRGRPPGAPGGPPHRGTTRPRSGGARRVLGTDADATPPPPRPPRPGADAAERPGGARGDAGGGPCHPDVVAHEDGGVPLGLGTTPRPPAGGLGGGGGRAAMGQRPRVRLCRDRGR